MYIYIIIIYSRYNNYGARARAGGTCLVAVLHAASVIGCWGRAAGAASMRLASSGVGGCIGCRPKASPPHAPNTR